MADYKSELKVLREKLASKTKTESMLSSLGAQLAVLRTEEQQFAKIRMDEQMDVDRLEKPGLASFFYSVISQKEGKLDKEKAEAYAAAIKHEAKLRQIEAVERDISSMKMKLSELSGIEAQYEKAFAEKEAAVRKSDPANAAEICRIEDRLGDISAQCREIEEAASVGSAALFQISAIEAELGSAAGWGTWDLIGGGLIAGLAKHSHLDDAQHQINELQDVLRRYRTELLDVKISSDIRAQIEGFLRFADFFFDGLFADWAVLDSIHSSQDQISSTRSQVEGVQRRLEEMKQDLLSEAKRLKTELDDVVLKA